MLALITLTTALVVVTAPFYLGLVNGVANRDNVHVPVNSIIQQLVRLTLASNAL